MKSEKLVFTDFNFSFVTFPRQVFVNIIDEKTNTLKQNSFVPNKGVASFLEQIFTCPKEHIMNFFDKIDDKSDAFQELQEQTPSVHSFIILYSLFVNHQKTDYPLSIFSSFFRKFVGNCGGLWN